VFFSRVKMRENGLNLYGEEERAKVKIKIKKAAKF